MNILNTYFDKIFIINLDSRPDRWKECEELLKQYDITNYERVSAIRPVYKEIPKNYYNNLVVNQKEWYVTGAVGCKLSHYKVIEIAKERNYDNFLVLEDDFSITGSKDNFQEIIKHQLFLLDKHTQEKDWDMIYLGGNNLTKPKKIEDKLHTVIKANTTHAYAMNHTIYDKCLNEMNVFGTEIDDYYKRHIQNKHNVYCIYPSIIKQRKSMSDIFQGSIMEYKFD